MRRLIAALTASLAFSAAAAAQTPAPSTTPPHTVEGVTVEPSKQIDPEALRAMVQDFVRLHGQPSRIGQYSVWARPLCPKVVGLPDAFDAFVAQRIVEVAAEAGAPKARRPQDCRHFNVLVIVTSQPQQILDFVRHRQPQLLGFHYAAQAERIAVVRRPIQVWHVTSTAQGAAMLDTAGSDVDHEVVDSPFNTPPSGAAGSRLSEGLTSHLLTALIVVNSRQIEGQPAGRIADQIAMEALLQPAAVGKCSEAPTVLDSLNPSCAASAGVDGLTDFDRTYLSGLYHTDPEQFLGLQKSAIGSQMKRALAPAPSQAAH